MKRIVHISDLHFGKQDHSIVEHLLNDINRFNPNLVVISGDLTQRAKSKQYKEATDFLYKLDSPIIAVPGNHDISLWNVFRRFFNPLKRFRNYITDKEFPAYKDENMTILGVNSARSLTIMGGRLSKNQIDHLKDYFCKIPEAQFKGIVIHHNLIPSDNIRSRKLMGKSKKFLSELKECGIDMVFSGHIHQFYSGDIQTYFKDSDSIILVQAGTALYSRNRKDKNSYNYIEITNDVIKIRVMEYNGKCFYEEKELIYNRKNKLKK